ncbi:hypothetical protein ISN76_11230 [Dyella halodurans]|uniref:Uncharacterized protein n=1 Tax=Dyella halodurans TaxID=1920171 RepID=A0ABV9C429_9GAMM|nr:hypothetical protein [Dyella halodurans]
MELARKLSEGVGSWLQYQHACHRSGLFSERYLAEPIGQILSAHTRARVNAEYHHPVLAPLATGPGAKPSVDFVVLEPYPKVSVAVESKWIGQTKPSVQSIMWDLIRLELIAHTEGAECFFVLGGMRRSLDAYFKQKIFTGPKLPHNPILHTKTNDKFQVNLSPTAAYRVAMMKKIFAKYQSTAFPHRVIARRTDPFPVDCKANQYQIYVWHITSKVKRDIFYPKNSTHYVDIA